MHSRTLLCALTPNCSRDLEKPHGLSLLMTILLHDVETRKQREICEDTRAKGSKLISEHSLF